VHTLTEELIQVHGLQLQLKYEHGRGYYLRLPKSDLDDRALPSVFVNVEPRKKFLEMTTLSMLKANAQVSTDLQMISG
jgi:DNA mismatch repair protein MSH4